MVVTQVGLRVSCKVSWRRSVAQVDYEGSWVTVVRVRTIPIKERKRYLVISSNQSNEVYLHPIPISSYHSLECNWLEALEVPKKEAVRGLN